MYTVPLVLVWTVLLKQNFFSDIQKNLDVKFFFDLRSNFSGPSNAVIIPLTIPTKSVVLNKPR